MILGAASATFVVAGLLLMAALEGVAFGIAVAAIGTVALLIALTSREQGWHCPGRDGVWIGRTSWP